MKMNIIKKVIPYVLLLFSCIVTTLIFRHFNYNLKNYYSIARLLLFTLLLIGADYFSNYEIGNYYIKSFEKTFDIPKTYDFEELYWDCFDIPNTLHEYICYYKKHLQHQKLTNYFSLFLSYIIILHQTYYPLSELLMLLFITGICIAIDASQMFSAKHLNFVSPNYDFEYFLPNPDTYSLLSKEDQDLYRITALKKTHTKYIKIINDEIHANQMHDALSVVCKAIASPLLFIAYMFYAFKANAKYTIFFLGITYSVLNIILLFV